MAIRRSLLDDPALAPAHLVAWLPWGWRCRLQPFVKLARTIRDQRAGIDAAIRHGLSNARAVGAGLEERIQ